MLGMDLAPATAADLRTALEGTGYLVDDDLATIAWLATRLSRPLLLEGEPGTGKTALAEALALAAGVPLIRLQCHEGIDASQALYDWDFPRQILHLRAVEAVDGAGSLDEVEAGLFEERFLVARPILRALREAPAVLLVDEIDRADDEFEAFLLEVLSTWQVSIPEPRDGARRGAAAGRPHVQPHPRGARRAQAALSLSLARTPLSRAGGSRSCGPVRPRFRRRSRTRSSVPCTPSVTTPRLLKPPGVAETLDWARALHEARRA